MATQGIGTRVSQVVVVTALAAFGLVLPSGVAHAFTTNGCSASSTTAVVTVAVDSTNGDFAFVGTDGSGNIQLTANVNGVQTSYPCGLTNSTADLITVTGSSLDDLVSIANIGPGATPDAGLSEIAWNINLGTGDDTLDVFGQNLTAGVNGVDLNNDKDPDATIAAGTLETLLLDGREDGGPARMSAGGGNGTGAAYADPTLIVGGSSNDTLIGGIGPDQITGGDGNDVERGGAGADSLGTFGPDALGDTGRNNYYGGAGADSFSDPDGFGIVDYSGDSAPVSVTLDGLGNDGLSGEQDNVSAQIAKVVGTSGADTISAAKVNAMTATPYQFSGLGGTDHITGGPADDLLDGGAGGDVVSGGSGRDDVRGDGGNDKLSGGDGIDGLDGGSGTDSCIGGPSADVFEHCESVS
jgi:Ca2+-binding RTX toxin-like protein